MFLPALHRLPRRFLDNWANTTAQPTFNLKEVASLPDPSSTPSPSKKPIAAVLGALDDKIELNRRMNATLEAMARALFQSWFVDFDPVRAKQEGRPPAAPDEPTAVLFPAQFQRLRLRQNSGGLAILRGTRCCTNWDWQNPSKKRTGMVLLKIKGCSLGINSRHGELGSLHAADIRVF